MMITYQCYDPGTNDRHPDHTMDVSVQPPEMW